MRWEASPARWFAGGSRAHVRTCPHAPTTRAVKFNVESTRPRGRRRRARRGRRGNEPDYQFAIPITNTMILPRANKQTTLLLATVTITLVDRDARRAGLSRIPGSGGRRPGGEMGRAAPPGEALSVSSHLHTSLLGVPKHLTLGVLTPHVSVPSHLSHSVLHRASPRRSAAHDLLSSKVAAPTGSLLNRADRS